MWNQFITVLTETEAYYKQTRNRLLGLLSISLLVTLCLALFSIFFPIFGSFDRVAYYSSSESLLFLGTSTPYAFLTRTVLDWTFFGFGLCIGVGGLYNYLLGKPSSYLILSLAFLVIVMGSVIQSLSASRVIYSGESPKTYLVFVWFFHRFLILFSIGIGALFSIKTFRFQKWIASSVLLALFLAFIYFNLLSDQAFDLLYGRNFLTLTLFYLPLIGWMGLTVPAVFFYFKKNPSYFAFALLLSLVSQITIDLCIISQKVIVLVSGFNAVHILEVVCLIIPFIGLTWDQFGFYQKLQKEKLNSERVTETKLFFLSTVSEEMKFSTSKLFTYSQGICSKKEPPPSAEDQHALQGIKTMSEKLDMVVDNLTSLTAMEMGHLTIKQEEVRPKEIIERVLKTNDKEVPIEGELSKPVQGDSKRMHQVIRNLLTLLKESRTKIQLKEEETKVEVVISGSEMKWSQDQINQITRPLSEKQTTEPELLKYQLLMDFSKKVMSELGGEMHLQQKEKSLEVALTFPRKEEGKG